MSKDGEEKEPVVIPGRAEHRNEDRVLHFSSEQQELITELVKKQIKVSIDKMVDIRRLENGKIVFLEQGSGFAGLQHILIHAADFEKRGICHDEIADVVMTAIIQGKIVGYQGNRPTYVLVLYKGKKQYIAIAIGDNGFIVGANPATFP